MALRLIHKWNSAHGGTYKQIRLAHGFLQRRHRVNFSNIQATSQTELLEEVERDRRNREHASAVTEAILVDFEARKDDINESISELRGCLDILLPRIPSDTTVVNATESTDGAGPAIETIASTRRPAKAQKGDGELPDHDNAVDYTNGDGDSSSDADSDGDQDGERSTPFGRTEMLRMLGLSAGSQGGYFARETFGVECKPRCRVCCARF